MSNQHRKHTPAYQKYLAANTKAGRAWIRYWDTGKESEKQRAEELEIIVHHLQRYVTPSGQQQ